MNDIVREVATTENVMLVDLDEIVPKSNDWLYDMVHLHGKGSEKVATIIFKHLEKELLGDSPLGNIYFGGFDRQRSFDTTSFFRDK